MFFPEFQELTLLWLTVVVYFDSDLFGKYTSFLIISIVFSHSRYSSEHLHFFPEQLFCPQLGHIFTPQVYP